MFTGIVERTATVVSRQPAAQSTRLVLETDLSACSTKVGDSIAVNGCCLTVVEIQNNRLTFDLLHETEQVTNLKCCVPGGLVNLEWSLRMDDRMGGHFVTGHVDSTGTILRWEQVGKDFELEVSMPREFERYMVPKGCIALDGISLTVVKVFPDKFTIWIIPHTREITALRARRPGDLLNLEFDLIAKYTEKILAGRAATS